MVIFVDREVSIQRKRQLFPLVQREGSGSRTSARRLGSGGEAGDPGVVTCGGHAMGLLRLAVFGSPKVFHDERRLSFALRKAEALLLYLAIEGGMHSRSHLAALLWPDSESSSARNALRNALALLRSLLADDSAPGHSHLLQEQELLGLDPQAHLERDLDVVQRAWKAAHGLAVAPSEEHREALVATVQHALSLVRGPFLDGFWLREDTGFDEWHEQQQQQWQVRVQLL
jgi:DNA-binding SARP family transcriptional activator